MINTSLTLIAGGGLLAGLVVGGWHFALLGWNARFFAAGRTGVALAVQAVRCGLTVALLYALAHVGALALVTAMAGVLVARQIAVHHAERLR